MNKLQKIEEFVKKNVDEANWIHTQAMRPIAERLAELEGADKVVVDVAVLFHDIAKDKVSLLEHAQKSAEMCEDYLKTSYSLEHIKKVVYCIKTHSAPWAKNAPMPNTIEAKVLFDADMIQQLSAFGIAKHILKYKDKNFNDLIESSKKDLVGAYELLMTESGKKLGKERINYVKTFFKNCIKY